MGNRIQTLRGDTSGQPYSRDLQSPAYAATIAITPNSGKTLVVPGQLTGALTVNVTDTDCKTGDELVLLFNTDGTSRTVTFGTSLISSATLVVPASKKASASFTFDGSDFVETGRAIQS